MERELEIFSVKDGHKVRKYDPGDKDDLDDLVNVIRDKLASGWILYGGKKKGDLKKLADSTTPKSEIKELMKDKENMMMDSPAGSEEESVFYERKVLAAPVQGGIR